MPEHEDDHAFELEKAQPDAETPVREARFGFSKKIIAAGGLGIITTVAAVWIYADITKRQRELDDLQANQRPEFAFGIQDENRFGTSPWIKCQDALNMTNEWARFLEHSFIDNLLDPALRNLEPLLARSTTDSSKYAPVVFGRSGFGYTYSDWAGLLPLLDDFDLWFSETHSELSGSQFELVTLILDLERRLIHPSEVDCSS